MSCYWKRGLDRVKVENIYAKASDQTLNQQKLCQIGTRIAQTQHKIGTRMTPFRRRNSVSKQWRWRSDQRHIWGVSAQLVLKIGTRSPALDYHLFRLIQNISGRDISSSWTLVGRPWTHLVPMMSPSVSRQRMLLLDSVYCKCLKICPWKSVNRSKCVLL